MSLRRGKKSFVHLTLTATPQGAPAAKRKLKLTVRIKR